MYERYGRAVVAVSEGLSGPDQSDFLNSAFVRNELSAEPYTPILGMLDAAAGMQEASGGAKRDAFGHIQLSGTGMLADVLASGLVLAAILAAYLYFNG